MVRKVKLVGPKHKGVIREILEANGWEVIKPTLVAIDPHGKLVPVYFALRLEGRIKAEAELLERHGVEVVLVTQMEESPDKMEVQGT